MTTTTMNKLDANQLENVTGGGVPEEMNELKDAITGNPYFTDLWNQCSKDCGGDLYRTCEAFMLRQFDIILTWDEGYVDYDYDTYEHYRALEMIRCYKPKKR